MSDPRTELAAAGARLAALGLSPGSSGNLSVRIDDRVLITPTGADLAEVDPDGLSVLALDGTHLDGPRPSKEFPLHGAFYRRDDATRAVVHLHARNATAVSCLPPWSARSAVPPLTPYFVMRVGQTPSSRTPRPATRTRPRPWPCCPSRSVRHSSRTTAPSSLLPHDGPRRRRGGGTGRGVGPAPVAGGAVPAASDSGGGGRAREDVRLAVGRALRHCEAPRRAAGG